MSIVYQHIVIIAKNKFLSILNRKKLKMSILTIRFVVLYTRSVMKAHYSGGENGKTDYRKNG